MQLRPYQLEMIDAIHRDWESGFHSLLLVAATGSGKTQVFCEVLHRHLSGARGLVLVHRKELVEQARDRLIQYWPEYHGRAGIVMAEQDECATQIIFATVQTLSSEARLARVLAHGPIAYVITDEAHHATAESYQSVYTALRLANPDFRHLGVTATPLRADEQGLVQVFEKVTATYDIRDLVKLGYLVPPRWLAIQTGISLAQIALRYSDGEKDFSAKQLANVYETSNCFELVVKSHQQYAAERQAVAFTVTVAGAHQLAEQFRAAGLNAQAADATTDKARRRAILADFRAGRLQILCNVGLYTEGLDVPEVSCIHQVRPTQSDGLYIQMIGRALRTFPAKSDALILDYAPKEARQIVMLGDVLGAPVRKDAYVTDKQEPGDVLGGFTFDGTFHWLKGNPAEIISRQLDYLQLSPFVWYRGDDGLLTLGLGQGSDEIERTLVITAPHDGRLKLFGIAKRGKDYPKVYAIAESESFDELSAQADTIAAKRGNALLMSKGKQWRKQPVSEAQEKFLRKLNAWRDDQTINRDLAARLITHALAVRAVEHSGLC